MQKKIRKKRNVEEKMAKIIGFKSNLTVREIKKKLATNIFFPRRRVGHKFKEKIK